MAAIRTRNSTKGPKTRELIFETAIALFQKNGFDQTTMRDIAAKCDVSLGNAYYYFRSKEHLIFALYERTLTLQLAKSESALQAETHFSARLQAVLRANLQTLQPYRAVFRALFRLAADPDSPLNPFSDETKSIRESALSMFRQVVEGSIERMSASVRKELPELLWLSYMGLVLYWLHDRSTDAAKSQRLITMMSDIFGFLITVISLPMMDKLWQMILKTVDELRQ